MATRIDQLLYDFTTYVKTSQSEQAIEVLKCYPELIRHTDFLDEFPLMIASRYDCTPVVQYLVDQEIDINRSSSNSNALSIAAREGSLNAVNLLLDAGADPDLCRAIVSAVLAKNNKLEIIKTLLNHHCDVNQVFLMFNDPSNKRTALDFCRAGSAEELLLRENGAVSAKSL
ncbi:ankyrin repeat domain-containing protein [Stieleria varia]|uniref:Ankyrin repeats (3 copies) n=1 Tax=Stieleria varia TaxID=2528005 RepID=A0A5C5ZVE0_9BACT|nr:ankyrin repeat domain-containing protein [Stieleria varia]TWT91289.1 Ankyrin repeats (3 copies) [Stieleria varia]